MSIGIFFDFRTRTALRSHQANKKNSVIYTLNGVYNCDDHSLTQITSSSLGILPTRKVGLVAQLAEAHYRRGFEFESRSGHDFFLRLSLNIVMPALKRTRLTASAWRKTNWCINCVLMRVMERRERDNS